MLKNWRHTVISLAWQVSKMQNSPLFIRSWGSNVLKFFSRCGKSNVFSFVLRPIFLHNRARLMVGILLLAGAGWASINSSPLSPSEFAIVDTGGQAETTAVTVSAGEVHLRTTLAIRPPLDHLDVSQKYWLLHSGIDFRTPIGTEIHPLMSGVVSLIKNDIYGYGNYVMVAHDNGYSTLYAHMSKILVKEGVAVTTDSILGLSGSTGRSTGPHLHFEIHDGLKTIDPAPILGLKL